MEGLFSSFDGDKIDPLGCILALFKESDSNTSQIRNSAIRELSIWKLIETPASTEGTNDNKFVRGQYSMKLS